MSDWQVRIPVRTKLTRSDALDSRQPLTSLFAQSLLLYGDARAKGIELRRLCLYHANLE